MNKLLKHICYFLVTCLLLTHNNLLTDNVSPAITDPDQLKAVETERQTIFNSLIIEFSKTSYDNCIFSSYRVAKNKNNSSIEIFTRSNLQITADISYVCLTNNASS